MFTKRFYKNPLYYLILLALLMVVFGSVMPTNAQSHDPEAQDRIEAAWAKVEEVTEYGFRTRLHQSVYPEPSVANAGRPPREDKLAFEGINYIEDQTFEMTLWQDWVMDPARGIEMKVEEGKAYARQGEHSEWEEINDISSSIAPGGDPLSFLGGLSNVEALGTDSRTFGEVTFTFERYSFDLDSVAFAEHAGRQMDAAIIARGELPAGMQPNSAERYKGIEGSGEIWIGADGYPARIEMDLSFPPNEESGEFATAIMTTDFMDYEVPLPVYTANLMSQPIDWVVERVEVAAQPENVAAGGYSLLLIGLLFLLVLLIWKTAHTKTFYNTTVSLFIMAMIVPPLVQANEVRAFYDEQREAYAEQLERNEEIEAQIEMEERLRNSEAHLPQENPYAEGEVLKATQVETLSPLPADIEAQEIGATILSEIDPGDDFDGDGISNGDDDDDDNDGLLDSEEVPAGTGTHPYDNDSDDDGLSDYVEVMLDASQLGDGNLLDPLDDDTNDDGRLDGDDCFNWNRANTYFDETNPDSIVCEDSDDDGVYDIAEDDDDDDGILDDSEIVYGTDPTKWDTDGDGLADLVEIESEELSNTELQIELDVLLADTNGDGRADGEECLNWNALLFEDYKDPDVIVADGIACEDTDGDGIKDVHDEDDDGDMMPDRYDLNPASYLENASGDGYQVFGNEDPLSLSIKNAAVDQPLLVNLQFRTVDTTNLAYNNHILDWPNGDYEGQINRGQDTTFYSTQNMEIQDTASTNANYGDILITPLIEVIMPFEDGHYANLPVLDSRFDASGDLNARTDSITVSEWIDTSVIEDFYNVVVKDSDEEDPGELTAYLPLTTIYDDGGLPIAFESTMYYYPMQGSGVYTDAIALDGSDVELADWGSDHEYSLIWLVQMITDDCVDDSLLNSNGEPCSDSLDMIQVYREDWYLTGISVSEEHGSDGLLLYEDPDEDDNVKSDDTLWAYGTEMLKTFINGLDCGSYNSDSYCLGDGDGQVDIALEDLVNINGSNNVDDSNEYDWGAISTSEIVSSNVLDTLIESIASESNAILRSDFLEVSNGNTTTVDSSFPYASILYAYESEARGQSLAGSELDSSSGNLTINMKETTIDTTASFFLRTYEYDEASDVWSEADLESYLAMLGELLEAQYQESDVIGDSAESSFETMEDLQLWAATLYLLLYTGETNTTAIDGESTYGVLLEAASDLEANLLVDRTISASNEQTTGSSLFGVSIMVVILDAIYLYLFRALHLLKNKKAAQKYYQQFEITKYYQAWTYEVNTDQYGKSKIRYPGYGRYLWLDGGLLKDTVFVSKFFDSAGWRGFYAGISLIGGALSITSTILLLNDDKSDDNFARSIGYVGTILGTLNELHRLSASYRAYHVSIKVTKQVSEIPSKYSLAHPGSVKRTRSKVAATRIQVAKGALRVAAVQAGIDIVITGAIIGAIWIYSKIKAEARGTSKIELNTMDAYFTAVFILDIAFALLLLIPGLNFIIIAALLVDAVMALALGDEYSWVNIVTEELASAMHAVDFYAVNLKDDDRIEATLKSLSLTDDSLGFIKGSSLDITLGLTNTLWVKGRSDSSWSNQEQVDKHQFEYELVNSTNESTLIKLNKPTHDVDNAWTFIKYENSQVFENSSGESVRTGGMLEADISNTVTMNKTGINADISMGTFVEAANVPVYGCWFPDFYNNATCYNDKSINIVSSASAGSFTLDVMPTTLTEFVAFSWTSSSVTLPRQWDQDNDGLINRELGGADVDDQSIDTDNDGLSDYFEINDLGTDPEDPDMDKDGLTDGEEYKYGTDPTDPDMDDDGLPDYNEVKGWEIWFENGNDSFIEPVYSSVDDADTDGDGIGDLQEFLYGLNPNYPSDLSVIDTYIEFDELSLVEVGDSVSTDNPSDRYVRPGAELSYSAVVSNTTQLLESNGLLFSDVDMEAPDLPQPALVMSFDESERFAFFTDRLNADTRITCQDEATCPASNTIGAIGTALYFDGVDDEATLPVLSQDTDQTGLFFWLKPEALPSSGDVAMLMDTDHGDVAGTDLYIDSSGNLYLETEGYSPVLLAGDLTVNEWIHIGYQNGDVYNDGTLVTNSTGSQPTVLQIGTGRLGSQINGTAHFNGYLDELLITNESLNADDIMVGIYIDGQVQVHFPFNELQAFPEKTTYYDGLYGNHATCEVGTCPTFAEGAGFDGGNALLFGSSDRIDITNELAFDSGKLKIGKDEIWSVYVYPGSFLPDKKNYIYDTEATGGAAFDLYLDDSGRIHLEGVSTVYDKVPEGEWSLIEFKIHDWSVSGSSCLNYNYQAATCIEYEYFSYPKKAPAIRVNGGDWVYEEDGNVNFNAYIDDGVIGNNTSGTAGFQGLIDQVELGVGHYDFEAFPAAVGYIDQVNDVFTAGCDLIETCPELSSDGVQGDAIEFGVDPEALALSLDGNEYLVLDNGYDFAAGDYTIGLWFKSSVVENQTLLAATENGNHGVLLELSSSGTLRYLERFPAGASGGVSIYSSNSYADGNWHYLTAVKENGTLSLYVDGALEASASGATGIPAGPLTVELGYIGAGNEARFLDGSLDELVILHEAVDASGVNFLMNSRLPAIEKENEVETFALSAGETKTVAGTATVSEQLESSRYRWEQEVEVALELATELSYTEYNNVDGEWSGYFRFEEVPGDSRFENLVNYGSGGSYAEVDGTCADTSCPVGGVRGIDGRAAYFDGEDDYLFVDIHGSAASDEQPTTQAISVWIKGSKGTILDTQGTTGSLGMQLDMGLLTDANGETLEFVVPPNRWAHVAVSIDESGNATVYVDGEVAATGSGFEIPSGGYTVGASYGTQNHFHGYMDELRIYAQELTADEVAWLSQSAAPTLRFEFDEAHGETNFVDEIHGYVAEPIEVSFDLDGETVTELSPLVGTDGRMGNSAFFSGVDNGYLSLPGSTGLGDFATEDFTFMTWIKTEGTNLPIWAKDDGDGSNEAGEKLLLVNGDGMLSFWDQNQQTGEILGDVAVNDGNWQHVALVWDDAEDSLSCTTTSFGSLGNGLTLRDGINFVAGSNGYLMYTAEAVHNRFIDNPPSFLNATNLVVVYYATFGGWQYVTESGTHAFTPSDSDVLLAKLDFVNEEISYFEGVDQEINGISAGYDRSDLVITPNRWGVAPEQGEFNLSGTQFESDCVIVEGASSGHVYVNGVEVTSDSSSYGVSADPQADSAQHLWTIGRGGIDGSLSYFDGQLDEFTVYNGRALGGDEVFDVYQQEARWYRDSVGFDLVVDNDAPTIEVMTDYVYRNDGYIQLVAAPRDATSWVSRVEFGLKGPGESDYSWETAEACSDSLVAVCPTFISSGEGIYEVIFRVIDGVGHETISEPFEIVVDTSAPTVSGDTSGVADTLVETEDGTWTLTLSGSVADPAIGSISASGVNTEAVGITLYDTRGTVVGSPNQLASVDGAGGWTISYELDGLAPTGSYTATLEAEDLLGNRVSVTLGTLTLDAQAPAVQLREHLLSSYVISDTSVLEGVISDQAEWPDAILALHFEEEVGSTTFYDYGEFELQTDWSSGVAINPAGAIGSGLDFEDEAAIMIDAAQIEISGTNETLYNFGPNDDFTIAFWMQVSPEDTQVGSESRTFNGIISQSFSFEKWPFEIGIHNQHSAGLEGILSASRNDSQSISELQSSIPLNDGQLRHITFMKEGETLSLYIDGKLDGTTVDQSVQGTTTTVDASALMIGDASRVGAERFYGMLDEVMIYNDTLTADQIYSLAQRDVSGVGSVELSLEEIDFAQIGELDPLSEREASLTWEAATLSQPSASASEWSYEFGTLENWYYIHQRGSDAGGNAASPETVWSGLIDHVKPVIDSSYSVAENGEITYAFTASDFILDESSLTSPCGDGDLTWTRYAADLDAPQADMASGVSASCTFSEAAVDKSVSVCDMAGNCAVELFDIPSNGNLLITFFLETAVWQSSYLNRADLGGFGIGCAYLPCPSPVEGVSGSGLEFDGIDNTVKGGGYDYELSQFTLAAWIYSEDSDWSGIMGFANDGPADRAPSLYVKDGDKLFYGFGDGAEFVSNETPSGVISQNVWQHVAVTFDGQFMVVYVDGVVVQVDKTTFAGKLPQGIAGWGLGHIDDDGYFDGKIDEVHVFDYPLSESGILELVNLVGYTPPVAVDDSVIAYPETAVTIPVLANDSDVDGDSLTIMSFGSSQNGSVTLDGDTLIYTSNAGFEGSDSFNYTISDGLYEDDGRVDISVAGNNKPVAVDDVATTESGLSIVISVLANDSDPDGDSLTLEWVDEEQFVRPVDGSVVQDGDTIIYTPANGFVGEERFYYGITDGELEDYGTVRVTVTEATSSAPTAVNDSATTAPETAVTIPVLANDSDAEGDSLSIDSWTAPLNGTVTQSGDSLVYTPNTGYAGNDAFTYMVSDGSRSSSASVKVAVSAVAVVNYCSTGSALYRVNAGGSLLSDSLLDWEADSEASRSPYLVAGANVSSYATDDGFGGSNASGAPDALFDTNLVGLGSTTGWEFPVSNGEVTVQLYFGETWNGAYTAGSRVFDVMLEDGLALASYDVAAAGGVSDALVERFNATVSDGVLDIDFIKDINNPFVSGIEICEAAEEVVVNYCSTGSVLYRVNAGGPLLSDSLLDWEADTNSSRSPYLVGAGNLKSYTPSAGFSGSNDTGVPDALFDVNVYSNGQDLNWEFPVSNGEVTVKLYFGETWGGASNPGARIFDVMLEEGLVLDGYDVSGAGGYNDALMESFNATVSDGVLDLDIIKETQNPFISGIEICGVETNEAPLAVDDSATTEADTAVTIPVLANDSDPDGDSLSIDSWTAPINGTVTQSGDSLIYTPNDGYAGSDAFLYTVSDGSATSSGSVSVTVNPPAAVNYCTTASVLYRVNGGGPLLSDSLLDWGADTQANRSPYLVGSSNAHTYDPNAGFNGSNATGAPDALFDVNIHGNGGDMTWEFPVNNGEVTVNLYFGETWNGATNAGVRIFDVKLEEGLVLDGYDVAAAGGVSNALVESFNVTVSDGVLDLDFIKQSDNAFVSGIEICGAAGALPVSAVTASSSYESASWGVAKAVDGQLDQGWSSNNSRTVDHTEWIQLDLGQVAQVEQVLLYPRGGGDGFPIDFTIQVSADCATWNTVVTKSGYPAPNGEVLPFNFGAQAAQCVKVEGTSLRQNPNDNNQYRMQFMEVEVYQIPVAVTSPTVWLELDEASGSTSFANGGRISSPFACSGSSCPTAGLNAVSGQGVLLDGSNDALSASGLALDMTNFTLAAWVYPGQSNGWMPVFGYQPGGLETRVPSIYISSNQKIHVGLSDGSAWQAVETGAGTVTPNSWQHIAMTFDGQSLIVYLDGVPVLTDSSTYAGIVPPTATNYIIGNASGNSYLKGMLDEVLIYEFAMSADEISTLVQSGVGE